VSGLLQFAIGTSATLTETFLVDGTPTDLDSGVPVVTITRPDSMTIASGTVSHVSPAGSNVGKYQFVLAALTTPTILDVAWTGTIGGQSQTLRSTVEILGADLFGIAELRALKVGGGLPFSSTATPLYSDAQLHDARTATGDELTEILGFPPVPRFARETLDGRGRRIVFVADHKTTSLLSVRVDGTAQTLTDFVLADTGRLTWTAGTFPATTPGNVVVEYVHGWPRPKGKGGHMAMMMAAAMLLPDGFQTTTTFSTPDGATYTYEPSETGRGGFQRWTGIRVVDKWLNLHADARVLVM
jgi:hypothetical protein